MRRLLLVAGILLGLSVTGAIGAEEVKVTADSFVIDEAISQATFSGNVQVVREGMQIWANKVVVGYGAGGVNDIQSFEATGGVRIKTTDQVATGERAVFVPATQILTMSGNVEVENAVGTLTGPQLVINLETNETVFSGGGGSGRVTGVFTPQ